MRPGLLLLPLSGAAVMLGGAGGLAAQDVSVVVTGLRSGHGQLLACLTAQASAFPDCSKDPASRKLTVPLDARGPVTLDFGNVAPGRYAVSLIHDENANGKLDTALMLPREGYGFSRDAPVVFGPPSFAAAAFAVAGEPVRQTIRVRYILGGGARREATPAAR